MRIWRSSAAIVTMCCTDGSASRVLERRSDGAASAPWGLAPAGGPPRDLPATRRMTCYYNDSDPFVCAWLRKLIAARLIPAGDVDERPIQEVSPEDVRGYTQAHFFAGIGGWAYALRLAGWPDDRPVWTGSAPCQPFSIAGTG